SFGRWLTLFVLLPFGGAFATLVFVQEMLHLCQVYVHVKGGLTSAFKPEPPSRGEPPPLPPKPPEPQQPPAGADDEPPDFDLPEAPDEEGLFLETPGAADPRLGGLHPEVP